MSANGAIVGDEVHHYQRFSRAERWKQSLALVFASCRLRRPEIECCRFAGAEGGAETRQRRRQQRQIATPQGE